MDYARVKVYTRDREITYDTMVVDPVKFAEGLCYITVLPLNASSDQPVLTVLCMNVELVEIYPMQSNG